MTEAKDSDLRSGDGESAPRKGRDEPAAATRPSGREPRGIVERNRLARREKWALKTGK